MQTFLAILEAVLLLILALSLVSHAIDKVDESISINIYEHNLVGMVTTITFSWWRVFRWVLFRSVEMLLFTVCVGIWLRRMRGESIESSSKATAGVEGAEIIRVVVEGPALLLV